MSKWILKAVSQKVLSLLPFGRRVAHDLHGLAGNLHLTDQHFNRKVKQLEDHLCAYHKYAQPSLPKSCLELGTGWHPVIPVLLYLKGCDKIYTIDLYRLASVQRIRETIEFVLARMDSIPGAKPGREEMLRKLLQQENSNALMTKLNIQYFIGDVRDIQLPGSEFEFVISNNTLQHIHRKILPGILEKLRNAAHADAVHSHFIDLIDQFHHYDRELNRYNFLKYSPARWKWIDNSIVHQNRLRLDDYRELFTANHYSIVEEVNSEIHPEEFHRIKLHDTFRSKEAASCMVTHSTIIAKRS